jgi:hypothetical protein
MSMRDVAQGRRLGLEAPIQSAESCIIAADTVMRRSNRELMAAEFLGVPRRDDVGENETLLASDKACRLLGYAPAFSWRTQV